MDESDSGEVNQPRQFVQVNDNGMLFMNYIDSIDDKDEKKIAIGKIIANQLLINNALANLTLQ